jgi:hypothetical protein
MNYKLWEKLFPGDEKKIDTVEDCRESQGNGMQEWRRGDDVLNDAFMAWQALDRFRREADRNKMYVFEDQWGDVVEYEGCRMKERDAIKMQGNQPITNNRLRGIVRSISGVFQANQTEPLCVARERNAQFKGEIMTQTLQYFVRYKTPLDGIPLQTFRYPPSILHVALATG